MILISGEYRWASRFDPLQKLERVRFTLNHTIPLLRYPKTCNRADILLGRKIFARQVNSCVRGSVVFQAVVRICSTTFAACHHEREVK